jgi:hypothetical protein
MIKKRFYIELLAILSAVIFLPQFTIAQTDLEKLEKTILELDSLFWKGYNSCDTALCSRFLAADIAFYHDKGGPTVGRDTMLAIIKKNLCGNPATYRLRREPIKKTIRVFPMQKNGTIYGAIFSGEHFFYLSQNGQKEQLDGYGRFTHLWLLQNGEWKMTYILSYDHGPAATHKSNSSK